MGNGAEVCKCTVSELYRLTVQIEDMCKCVSLSVSQANFPRLCWQGSCEDKGVYCWGKDTDSFSHNLSRLATHSGSSAL